MQGSRWCFTLNNYNDDDVNIIKSIPHMYLVFGYEVSESGTHHLQGFLTLKNKKRLSGMKKLHGTAHWEVAKGTSLQASDYCKKENNFFEDGTPPSQGKRTDIQQVCNMIKQGVSTVVVANEFPSVYIKFHRGIEQLALKLQVPYTHSELRGLWFTGKPGSGKSLFARRFAPFYLKPQNKWFDGYAGEQTIILDDFDTGGIALGHHLKIWTDRYACTGETKGGTVHLRHHQFIITSNFTIEQMFSDVPEIMHAILRRFTVRDFNLFPYRYELDTTPVIVDQA